MKQRFSSLDVKAIAHELNQKLTGLRLSNIYDLSSRIFLLKFHKPEQREQLVIETGFRVHLTHFARETAPSPSSFVQRLRKVLKTRRVSSVVQVGTDRVLEIQFQDGRYRLLLEFFAAGNIILTSADLNVLALFRNVSEGPDYEHLQVGASYKIQLRQNYAGVAPLTREGVRKGLQSALDSSKENGASAAAKTKSKKANAGLRRALASVVMENPPVLLDHALSFSGLDPSTPIHDVLQDDAMFDKIMLALEESQRVRLSIAESDECKGFIIASQDDKALTPEVLENFAFKSGESAKPKGVDYEEYVPFRPHDAETDPDCSIIEISGFNRAVDEYYSSVEGQKLDSKLKEREENARQKLENARLEHQRRIDKLQQTQQLNVRKADAIQANLDGVNEAAATVTGLVERGVDWVDIAKMIEVEQERKNPVALMIKLPLKLHENTITLLLHDLGFEDLGGLKIDDSDDDFEGDETDSDLSDGDDRGSDATQKKTSPRKSNPDLLSVDIDLGVSAWLNASRYHDQKKLAATKEAKTLEASEKALRSTEQKIAADLKKGLAQEKEVLRPVRQQFWFEKFLYFISSDGYLVIGGRDVQQNDQIYLQYLKPGDAYVHADIQGAASIIIKNDPSDPTAPIPPATLSQAGNLAVATSVAWDSKAVMAAWWVNAKQVSKTSPQGDYMGPGEFQISGTKNFLPPAQHVFGFGALFLVSDESKLKHARHRIANDATLSQADTLTSKDVEKVGNGQADDAVDVDSDSDEDFPDARLESESEEDDIGSKAEATDRTGDADTEASNAGVQDDETYAAEEQTLSQAAERSSRPHMSAYERRILRKGAVPSHADSVTSTNTEGDSLPVDDDASEAGTTIHPQSKPNKSDTGMKRGQRSRAKKIKAKYADQDDEDRELALRLVGASHAAHHQKTKEEDAQKRVEEAERQRERRRAQHDRGRKAEEARQKAREVDDEEGGEDAAARAEEDETVRQSLLNLDALVGAPLPGDEILAAIPVSGPWAALARCRYKVKLQPGAVKKGKLVREILGRWGMEFKAADERDRRRGGAQASSLGSKRDEGVGGNEVKEKTEEKEGQGEEKEKVEEKAEDAAAVTARRERDCIRAWKETEVFGVVPVGKARVVAGASGGGGAFKGKQSGGKAAGKGASGKGGDKSKGKQKAPKKKKK